MASQVTRLADAPNDKRVELRTAKKNPKISGRRSIDNLEAERVEIGDMPVTSLRYFERCGHP
jgi:hypothetical protein